MPELHTRALNFLSEQSHADPARLAFHAEAASDGDAVLQHAPAAATRASRLGAHREAIEHYRRALRYADALPTLERAELSARYADECTAVDQAAEAVVAAEEAFRLWQELGEEERAAQVIVRRAYLLWGQGHNHEARRAAREAMESLEGLPPGLAHATAYSYAAHLHILAREIPQAIEVGNRAVALAAELGDPALRARGLTIVGAAQWFVEPDHDPDIHGDYCQAWSARSAFEQGRWSEASETADARPASPPSTPRP